MTNIDFDDPANLGKALEWAAQLGRLAKTKPHFQQLAHAFHILSTATQERRPAEVPQNPRLHSNFLTGLQAPACGRG
jgi:hypothetical protein